MLRQERNVQLSQVLRIIGKKKLPKVLASANFVTALEEMRKNDYEALVIEPVDDERPLVFSGYSIISRLLEKKPSEYGRFSQSPCLVYCLSAGTTGSDSDLQSLFHVFESTTFGYALVHDECGKIFTILSLNELLPLFHIGLLSTDLHVADVASKPTFSMSRGSKIIDCLHEMESRKFRKVKIANGPLVVSDKLILDYLFNDNRLKRISKTPQRFLDGTLEDLDLGQVDWIDGKSSITEAAWLMNRAPRKFLLSDGGILTPWDLIIKPWRLGDLRISKQG